MFTLQGKFKTDAQITKGKHMVGDLCTNKYELIEKVMQLINYQNTMLGVSPCHKLFISNTWLRQSSYVPSM